MSASIFFFRALILTSVGLGLIGSFIDVVFPGLIPAPLHTAFEALPDTATPALVGAGALVVVTFGGTIVAIAGLLFFQPWSRTLAVSMTALSLLFYPLLGVSVQSGWAQLFLDLSTTLWGVVLAMSYFSSLSQLFESRRSN
jgi:urea transporter